MNLASELGFEGRDIYLMAKAIRILAGHALAHIKVDAENASMTNDDRYIGATDTLSGIIAAMEKISGAHKKDSERASNFEGMVERQLNAKVQR